MNNLQYIVEDNTRFAMHVAVELCESGDFDNVTEAVKWLMQERNDAFPEPSGWHKCPECGCVVGYTTLVDDSWSIMMDDYQIPYNHCPECGRPILRCDVEE